MHKARLVALEGLVRRLGLLGFQSIQVAHAVAAQAAIEPRARDGRAQEFTGDGQQVIQGQQQRTAQLHGNSFLHRCQGRLQAMRRVRAVSEDIALFPLVDGLLGDAVTRCQHGCALAAGGDFSAHRRRGASVLV